MDYSKMTIEELKAETRRRGLPVAHRVVAKSGKVHHHAARPVV